MSMLELRANTEVSCRSGRSEDVSGGMKRNSQAGFPHLSELELRANTESTDGTVTPFHQNMIKLAVR